MHIIIVANGWLSQLPLLEPWDLLLAADGGARHCLKFGLSPDYVIGDFDSLDEAELHTLAAGGAKILRFSPRKDYTDLELAIQEAVRLGATRVTLVGALGARWDQTLANIFLAAAYPQIQIRILDGEQEINFVRGGETLEVSGLPGDTVSLIPLSQQAKGIRTEHLEYPLDNEDLVLGSTRGVSNVLLQTNATIAVEQGLLMVTVVHH